ncbi:MAG: epoxyqueuosine reductase QueH [Campylobacterales bacterium]
MIVHICCSVDSWYFLGKIREKYPDERLIGFFYNPNIHPESEYQTRLIDARRSCEQLGIEWQEGEYDPENWMQAAKGLELEPEKGARCSLCFDLRLFKTAELADRLGHSTYTTTLLMSPKKDFSQLEGAANKLSERFAARFVIEDFRKGGGTQKQFALAKEKKAYQQNYCGCLYALSAQRAAQQKPAIELFSAMDRFDAASPDERFRLYAEREALEKAGRNYRIIKQRFLNWRLLSGGLWDEQGEAIDAEILPYSTGKLDLKTALIALDEARAVFEKQPGWVVTRAWTQGKESLRRALGLGEHDLTPVFIVEKLPAGTIRVRLRAELWEDARELLVALG